MGACCKAGARKPRDGAGLDPTTRAALAFGNVLRFLGRKLLTDKELA